MDGDLVKIFVSLIMGSLARLYMLRTDYRNYPSYPHGYVIHMSLGFIASSLGALAIPAIMKRDYMAVTILALAAQQFRDVREMERKSLAELEATELVPRGTAYIEAIARVFEARNYLAMLTALSSSLVMALLPSSPGISLPLGVLSGLLTMYLLHKAMEGKRVRDIAHVREGKLYFQGALLVIEGIVVMNIGLKAPRESFLRHGLGIIIEPKDDNARATLGSLGLRQAICHDAASILGVRLDAGEPDLMPLARLDINTGRVGLVLVPMERDIECLIEVVKRVPVVETSVRKPLQTEAGRVAED